MSEQRVWLCEEAEYHEGGSVQAVVPSFDDALAWLRDQHAEQQARHEKWGHGEPTDIEADEEQRYARFDAGVTIWRIVPWAVERYVQPTSDIGDITAEPIAHTPPESEDA